MAERVTIIIDASGKDAAKEIERVRRALKQLDEEERRGAEGAREVSAAADEEESSIGRATETIGKHIAFHGLWVAATQGIRKALSAVTVRLAALTAAIAVATVAIAGFLALKVAQFLDRLGAEGGAIAVTRLAFQNLAKGIDETGDALLNRLRRATLNTVDDFKLLQVGVLALSTGVATSGEQFEELARNATLLAFAAGKDASEGLDLMTQAIARNSIPLLKQLNLVVDTQEAHKEYAKSVDKTVEQLTEQEKITARTIAVLEKSREVTARQAIESGNLQTVNAALATQIENVGQAIRGEVADSPQLLAFKRELLALTLDLADSFRDVLPVLGQATDLFFGFARIPLAGLRAFAELLDDILERLKPIVGLMEKLTKLLPGGGAAAASGVTGAQVGDVLREAIKRQLAFQASPDALFAFEGVERFREGRGGMFPSDFKPQIADTEISPHQLLVVLEEFGAGLSDIEAEIAESLAAAGRAHEQFAEQMTRPLEGLGETMDEAALAAGMANAELRGTITTLDALGVSTAAIAERLGLSLEEVEKALGGASAAARSMARTWAGAMSAAVLATADGANALETLFASAMGALARQVETLIINELTASLGSVGAGLIGGLAGGAIGLLGTLFGGGRDRRPIPVHVTNPIRLERTIPENLFIQLIGASSGEIVEQFRVDLARQESRGGTVRLPRPIILTQGT